MDDGTRVIAPRFEVVDDTPTLGHGVKRSVGSLSWVEQASPKRQHVAFPVVDFDGDLLFLGEGEPDFAQSVTQFDGAPDTSSTLLYQGSQGSVPVARSNSSDLSTAADVATPGPGAGTHTQGDDGGGRDEDDTEEEDDGDNDGDDDDDDDTEDGDDHSADVNTVASPVLRRQPDQPSNAARSTGPPSKPSWRGHFSEVWDLQSLKMATESRSYRQLEDDNGVLTSTLGSLIPGGYKFYLQDPNYTWICPLRSCQRLFTTRASLGGHFNKHRRNLLNDNGDGTFTMVGTYSTQIIGESGLPAVVVSQIPGDPDEPFATPRRVPPQNQPDPAAQRRSSWVITAARPSDALLPAATNATAVNAGGSSSGASSAIRAAVKAAIESSTGKSGGQTDFKTPIPGDPVKMWSYIRPYLRQTSVPPKNGYVPETLGLPRLRDIQWNTEWKNGYFESFPRDITALIMHVTGERPPHPCSRCDQTKGPFHGCIVMASYCPVTNIVSCSNCWYHGYQTQCNLQNYLRTRVPTGVVPALPTATLDLTNGRTSGGTSGVPTPASSNRVDRPSDPVQPAALRRVDSSVTSRLSNSSPVIPSRSSQTPSITRNPPNPPNPPAVQKPVNNATAAPAVRQSQSRRSAPVPASSSASSVVMMGQAHMPVEALEMEDWEVGPGRMPSQAEPDDNVAFSNAYLGNNHSVAVANGISFQVEIVRPGTNRVYEPEPHTTRICSLASGKLKVMMQGEPELSIGPNGMFKIRPGVECTVENRIYIDCVLHVSIITTEDF